MIGSLRFSLKPSAGILIQSLLWILFFLGCLCYPSSFASAEGGSLRSFGENPRVIRSDEEELLDVSRSYLAEGNAGLAIDALEQFLVRYPRSSWLGEVYLLLAAAHAQKGDLRNEAETLETFVRQFPEEPRLGEVRLKLSRAYFHLGNLEEVIALWEGVSGNDEIKGEVYGLVASAYMDQEDYLNALLTLMKERALLRDPEMDLSILNQAIVIIRERLTEPELNSIVGLYGSNFPADEATIRLAELYELRGDYYRTERELRRFLLFFPEHSYVVKARDLLDRVREKVKSNRYLIAVTVPLSGKLGNFGKSALHGAEVALAKFKEALPGASVGLVIKDLNGTMDWLEDDLKGWFEEYRPVAVVGPLLSRDVERVSPIVESAGLFLITPGATVPELSGLGRVVFRNAMTRRFQCHAIAEYGVLTMKIQRFAILFPNERLGKRWADCFSEEVLRLGGEVVHAEPYFPDDTDFSRSILRLKEADLKKGGMVEIQGEGRSRRELSYSPSFQAIFLPGEAKKVGLLIPQLVFHNIDGPLLLGTGEWNTPELGRLAGVFAEGATFIDGFFQGSTDPAVRDFVARYRDRFRQEPDLFAAQAFDATRLILTAMDGGALTPEEIKGAITKTENFSGASGLISEVRNGEMIKKPFLVQMHHGRFVQLNAPLKASVQEAVPSVEGRNGDESAPSR